MFGILEFVDLLKKCSFDSQPWKAYLKLRQKKIRLHLHVYMFLGYNAYLKQLINQCIASYITYVDIFA